MEKSVVPESPSAQDLEKDAKEFTEEGIDATIRELEYKIR